MKKIYYINSCIRKQDSRTQYISDNIVKNCLSSYDVETIDSSDLDLHPYTENNNPVYHDVEKRFVDLSRKIANCDGLIISAPFWDMSFPALLKVFLEKLSLYNIMFLDNGKTCVGIAKCPFMFYVTTRGMDIPDDSHLEQATPYLKALCELWGIKKFDSISVYNCDYLEQDLLQAKIEEAIELGQEKLMKLLK